MLLLFSNPRVGLSLTLETGVSDAEGADLIDVDGNVPSTSGIVRLPQIWYVVRHPQTGVKRSGLVVAGSRR
jgi:hypothetical protein